MAVRVLVAEDEWLTAAALRSQVESQGYQVVGTVETGTGVLEARRAESFDLVLMDVQMPELDGLEATRLLMRSCPACVVIVTGKGQLKDTAEQAGAMGYAVKPLMPNQITPLVESSCRRFSLFMRVRAQVSDSAEVVPTWLLVLKAMKAQINGSATSEEEGFGLLERQSSEQGISLRQAAEEWLKAKGQ